MPILLGRLCLLALLPAAVPALGQTARHRADSLKQVIADHRARMVAADLSADTASSIDLRLKLAELVRSPEAVRLLHDAAVLADSSGLIADGIHVRERLSKMYTSSGDHKKALEEVWRVLALKDLRSTKEKEGLVQGAEAARARAELERDALKAGSERELAAAAQREHHMGTVASRWMFCALGLAFVAVSAVFLVVRSSGRIKHFRSELRDLRAEVEELKKPRNTYRQQEPVPVAPPSVVATGSGDPSVAPVMDATALAFFRRMAPERLTALQDARSRGDQEKAMRVVHTLRPHLGTLDPDGLGALCVRLRGMDPKVDPAVWEAGLDQLVRGVLVLLR